MKNFFLFFSLSMFVLTGKAQQTITNNFTICPGTSTAIVCPNVGNLTSPNYSLMPGQIASSSSSFIISPTASNSSFTVFISGLNSQNVTITNMAVYNFSITPSNTILLQAMQPQCGSTFVVVNSTIATWSSFQPTITWNPIPNSLNTNSTVATYLVPSTNPLTTTLSSSDQLGCITTATTLIHEVPPIPSFTTNNQTGTYSITCSHPTINITTLSNYSYYNNSLNYFWASSTSTFNTNNVSITSPGNYTLLVSDLLTNCTNSQIISIGINTVAPNTVFTPTFQNITCNLSSVVNITTVASPSINVSQNFNSPLGGTYTANNYTAVYSPMSPGIYSYCAVNNTNGCSTCKTFTVSSNQGFPTFSLTALNNFTLGCGSKSIDVINFTNGNTNPPGGPISYSLLPFNNYSINIPGTYTAVIKDNFNLCESRVMFSVLQNTLTPDIGVNVPLQILNCNTTSVNLIGSSQTQNTSYNWAFAGTPGSIPGNTINISVNFAATNQTLINTYTLTITDNNSTCKSTSVIPIYQNIFRPIAGISSGASFISCLISTVILTNLSSTGIPSSTGFPSNWPVIGYLWEGPSPQVSLSNSSTYLGNTPGVYTLTAKDPNNGCTSQTTMVISDNRIYPNVSSTPGPFTISCPGNFVTIGPVINGPLNGVTYNWTIPANATVTGALNTPTLSTNSPGIYSLAVTNTLSSCTTSVTLGVFACVGLENNLSINPFISTFPNPGNGIYTVLMDNLAAELQLEIYNSNGKLIKSQILSSEKNTIDLQQESNGIYFLRLTDKGNQIHYSKILKE